jgi:hypothetical protein
MYVVLVSPLLASGDSRTSGRNVREELSIRAQLASESQAKIIYSDYHKRAALYQRPPYLCDPSVLAVRIFLLEMGEYCGPNLDRPPIQENVLIEMANNHGVPRSFLWWSDTFDSL